MEFCKICNKRFINQEFLEKHIEKEHGSVDKPLSKGWKTPYGFCDFTNPVSYEEACELMQSEVSKLLGGDDE